MLTALSKTETIKMEQTTIPIENILKQNRKLFVSARNLQKRMEIQFWYLKFKIDTNAPIRIHWVSLEKLLGHKIQIYRDYEYRNAIWGLKYNDTKFLIWKSKRGTEITVFRDEPVEKVYDLLNYLHKLMGYPWYKEMKKKSLKTMVVEKVKKIFC